jgi:hypothetical protein
MPAEVRVRLVGDWAKARKIASGMKKGVALINRAADRAVHREAIEFTKAVKSETKAGNPGGKKLAPNRPLVVYRKRSNKPLINHADMVNAVRVKRVRQMEYFAGVQRSAKRRGKRGGSGGTSLVRLAELHEKGKIIIIKITPRMQRWFFADLVRQGRYAKRRRGKGTQPAKSKSSGRAVPSFRPGAILIIRLKKRPFITPVFKKRRRGAHKRILDNFRAELRKGPLAELAGRFA